MTLGNTFIALDIGTTFIKGAVLDLEKQAIVHISRQKFPDPIPNLAPRYYEIDPNAVVTAVKTLISDLLPMTQKCGGIVMCGQMGGVVLTNERGEPLSNYISWLDKRAGDHTRRKRQCICSIPCHAIHYCVRRADSSEYAAWQLVYLFCVSYSFGQCCWRRAVGSAHGQGLSGAEVQASRDWRYG